MSSESSLQSHAPASAPRYRHVSIGGAAVEVTQHHGELHMRSLEPLAEMPPRLLDRLLHWARVRPDQTFIAARQDGGDWRRVSYAQMLDSVRAIAQSLLGYGLSAERPLVLLSGNDIEHLQVALGAMYAGIPYCPVSPAYSLLSQDYSKLRHVCELLQPGLIFVSDAAAFGRAIDAVLPLDTPLISVRGELAGRPQVSFASLLEQPGGAEAEAAFAATGPDTIAKFLFTSGSTRLPKAVITTQRMLCANQQMLLQTFPVFGEEPPVLVDWLPWNHTFGGSHNLGIVLNVIPVVTDDSRMADAVRHVDGLQNRIFLDLLAGRVPAVHIDVKQRPMPHDILRSGDSEDRAKRARFQQWINAIWQEKDEALARVLER